MSATNWIGNAPAVAQVATATFGTYDATTTRAITIGGVAISALDTGSTLTAALTALAVLLNAGLVSGVAHPYFTAITWTSTATTIVGTAKVSGVPFVFAGSVSGGTGTCSNAYTVTTASSGPNDWSTAANWDNGVPVNGSVIGLSNSASNICWGLAQSGVTGCTLNVAQTFSGRVGLDYTNFATSVDGSTVSNPARAEYRTTNLQLGVTTWNHGISTGIGTPSGSARFCIDTGTGNCQAQIISTASSSQDTGRPAVRWIGNNASSILNIRSCPGGFGVAAEKPGDSAMLAALYCVDTSGQSKIVTGSATTCPLIDLSSGTHVIQSNNAITTFIVRGGNVRIEGTGIISTLTVNGGVVTHNNTATTTAILVNGGSLTGLGSSSARTWTALTINPGASASYNTSVVTVTTLSFRGTVSAS